MKKLYWICMSLAIVCAVLDVVFASLDLILPALITSIVMLVFVMIVCVIYICFVKYKCPKCNTIFKGRFLEIFFAPHTPTKRKMRCPMCNTVEWCDDWFDVKTKNKDVKK